MKGNGMLLTVAFLISLLLSIIAIIRGYLIYEMVTKEMNKW
jgi:hypothetical protein